MKRKFNDIDRSEVVLFCTGILFVVSFVFTLKLFLSDVANGWEGLLVTGLVISFELGKVFLVHRAITKKKVVDIILALVLVIISNCASLAYLVDKSNRSLESSKKNNVVYQAGLNVIEANQNFVKNSDKKKYRTSIKKSSLESFEIAKQMQKVENIGARGYNALFVSIHTLVNKNKHEKDKIPLELVILIFNGLISFTAEMLGVRFAFIYLESDQKKSEVKKEIVKKEKVEKVKEISQPIEKFKEVKEKVKDKKGIYEDNTLYTKEEMQKYINKMYNTTTTGISKGYQFLSKASGISTTKGDNIRVKLIEKGVLAKEENKTVIKMNKSEVVV